ncbi:hypothetical protein ACEQ6A_01545 [Rhizobium brockwellii]|uniref:hypothetical protein n=1 Tax=Rhizobium brockwellii TaxID=3019932 RepID=UPI003F986F90
MASIEVDCYIRHCTDTTITRGDHEWRALKAVKVIKGDQLNGTFNFQIGGITTTVSARNQQAFTHEICQTIGVRIRQKYGKDVMLVPIPNSEGLAVGGRDFRTFELARQIAKTAGCEVSDILRWRSAVGKAHKNERARDPDAHKAALKVMRRTEKPIILFDDVVTSGSQLYGSQLALEAEGMSVIGMVAVAEVLDRGLRSDSPTWKKAVRSPVSLSELMKDFDF